MQGRAKETVVAFRRRTSHEAVSSVGVVQADLNEPNLSILERTERSEKVVLAWNMIDIEDRNDIDSDSQRDSLFLR
jgi:hypothetical protein